MKNKIVWFAVFALLLCLFSSCGNKPGEGEGSTPENTDGEETTPETTSGGSDIPEPVLKPAMIPVNSTTPGIRILGERYLTSDSQINCDWTCSGVEFTFNNQGDSVRFNISATAGCYFRAYIDGEAWVLSGGTPYYTVTGASGVVTLKNIPKGIHTVRLVKATGYTLARAEITSVMLTGELLATAPSQKQLYIEFVGDSITCGWGTIGEHKWAYTDQDGTLAYPYLLAQALDADYSMTALSGQGLLCGDPGLTKGYLYASPTRDSSTPYAFERKADLVVINIGTNDYYHTEVTADAFRDAYRAFLNTVKEKNGQDCKILCLYNTMNDAYSAEIQAVAEELGGVNSGIWVYSLARTEGNQHPTIAEHQAYREVLLPLIERILKYQDSRLTLVPEDDGDEVYYDFPAVG